MEWDQYLTSSVGCWWLIPFFTQFWISLPNVFFFGVLLSFFNGGWLKESFSKSFGDMGLYTLLQILPLAFPILLDGGSTGVNRAFSSWPNKMNLPLFPDFFSIPKNELLRIGLLESSCFHFPPPPFSPLWCICLLVQIVILFSMSTCCSWPQELHASFFILSRIPPSFLIP